MVNVSSSAIRSVSYNAATGTLTIWFTSGGSGYDYYNVPQYIYDGFLQASSKGRYFQQYIREQYAA
jgi:KTSC domain